MSDGGRQQRDPMQHPLLRKLNNLLESLTGLRVIVVRPREDGWQQVAPGGRGDNSPQFCKLIQSSQEGVNLCKMCHVLMSAAASNGSREQTCHAGTHVFLGARHRDGQQGFAVIGSCMFADEGAWPQAEARGRRLGIPPASLRSAFDKLPRLTEDQRTLAKLIIDAIVDAVEEVCVHAEARNRPATSPHADTPSSDLARHLRQRLASASARANSAPAKLRRLSRDKPRLISVLEGLIHDRPDLPLTVGAVAAAARVTPNHLSMVFRRHTGKRFVDYLIEQRIDLAKRLLQDLSLNIADVAARAGFADAGYFTRRFRQKTRMSPRQWRQHSGRRAPVARDLRFPPQTRELSYCAGRVRPQ
jgi:AraC-like DNA-binding protein